MYDIISTSNSTEETLELGKRIAPHLKKGDVIVMTGDLGAGKTLFTSGILEYFGKKDERKLSVVNKKKYLLFLIFTGWCGGHHFYAKRYSTGLTYLLFFWSGFPLAMAIADWLIWLPKVPDENGNIEI